LVRTADFLKQAKARAEHYWRDCRLIVARDEGARGQAVRRSELIRQPAPTPIVEMHRLRFRARLRDRWVSASVALPRRRLGDALNRDDFGGLATFDDVGLGTSDGDAEPIGQRAAFGAVNLANVLFAVPIEDSGTVPDTHEWVRKRPERVQAGIGPFVIEGDLHVVEDSRLRDVIALARPPFVALARAVIQNELDRNERETCAVVYVNRRLLDFLIPARRQDA
jgi:hypothetical protein